MKTWFFRFVDEDSQPTGYVGMASAKTLRELFYVVAQFGDPFMAQITQAGIACGVLLHCSTTDGIGHDLSEPEVSQPFPLPGYGTWEWKEPRWNELVYQHRHLA